MSEMTAVKRPLTTLDSAEKALLGADEAVFQLKVEERFENLDAKFRNLDDVVVAMRWQTSLGSHVVNFVGACAVLVFSGAIGYSLILWTQQPPRPEVVKPVEKLCATESKGFSRHNLVITKADGTSSVMPMGACATIVETDVPKSVAP